MFRRKPTFAFIVAVLFALGAPVLAVTNPWLAEQNGLSILKAELPPCAAASQAQNRAFTVSNCVSATSCATTGTVTTRLVCDGTEWRALNAETSAGVAPYVLLAGDADGQTIQGSTGSNKARISLVGNDLNAYAGTLAQSHIGASATEALIEFGDGEIDGTYRVSASAAGLVITTPSLATSVTVADGGINLKSAQTPPTNANDACAAGDTIDTATFHYYCAATNTWVRVAMATWP